MKKIYLLFLLTLLPLLASADIVKIDGIYYNLVPKTKTAEVSSCPRDYLGAVIIPEMVSYEKESLCEIDKTVLQEPLTR